jgi:hypothetical protein
MGPTYRTDQPFDRRRIDGDAADDLLARIDRLESLDQIRQLPAKYALSLDTYGDEPVAPPAPLYRFLATFRRGEGAPRVNPKGGSATPAAT